MLEPDGLMMALQELATRTEQTFRITTTFHCPAPVLIEDNAVAKHLYRIAQEAVHNAVRHGRANTVVIRLLVDGDQLTLGIKDDGIGFSGKPGKHDGMGLHVMRYRARLINALLAIESEPNGGTSLTCSLGIGGTNK
jgi:signal transduction histidine kinase